MFFIFWILITVISTAWTYSLAKSSKRNVFGWMFLNFFIGIFVPIFLLILPNNNIRKCPFCAEAVNNEAKICKHCKSEFAASLI